MRPGLRVVVGLLLVFCVFGLCIHYGTTYATNWPHPTGDQLDDDYDEYIGERVLVIGAVQSTDPADGTIVIAVTDSADEVAAEIEVQDTTDPVEAGGTVQVYGTLGTDNTMTASEMVIVNRDSTENQYKLVVSVVGILFAVAYFFSQWRVDRRELGFEQRARAISEETSDG